MLSIRFNIYDHDPVFFHGIFPKNHSFIKSIIFKRHRRAADASHFYNIEQTLNKIDSSTMAVKQLMQAHQGYFSSLSSELCTEVNKDIIIRDNPQ